MAAEVRLTRRARKDLEGLSETERGAVLELLESIGARPELAGRKLAGRLDGLRSARAGERRALYTASDEGVIVRAIR